MKFLVGEKEFEVKDADIQKALEEKKDSLELAKDVIVRSKDEDGKFVENMKKDARKEGVEIAIKKTREELGLDFEGKSMDKLVEALTAKVKTEAGSTEGEKVTKLENKLKEKETALQAAINKAAEIEKSSKEFKEAIETDRLIEQYIPKETILPVDDIKTILRNKLTVKKNEEGKFEVYNSHGELLKNTTTADPLAPKDAIENFFRDNPHYMKGKGPGQEGRDSGTGSGSGKMSMEDFIKDLDGKGIKINSPEYDKELAVALKDEKLDLA